MARSPTSSLDTHLGYWLRVVSNHVSHAFKAKVEARGVTVAEWVILRALLDEDDIRPGVLAERLGLTRGAVSKLLDRLAGKALVTIRANARDGRSQLVALTAAGRRLVPVLAALADRNDAELFGYLDDAERATLRALLEGIARHHGIRSAAVD